MCNNGKLALYTGYGVDMEKIPSSLRIPCKVFSLKFGRVDSLSMILSKHNQYTTVLNYQSVYLRPASVYEENIHTFN